VLRKLHLGKGVGAWMGLKKARLGFGGSPRACRRNSGIEARGEPSAVIQAPRARDIRLATRGGQLCEREPFLVDFQPTSGSRCQRHLRGPVA
jgi:hypothetical protein